MIHETSAFRAHVKRSFSDPVWSFGGGRCASKAIQSFLLGEVTSTGESCSITMLECWRDCWDIHASGASGTSHSPEGYRSKSFENAFESLVD